MVAFSIIIPTLFRHSAALRCLDSCLSQTLPSDLGYEIILVSSESDSDLRQRLEPYRKKYPQLHYYEAQGQGVNRARNLGATLARGHYCFFLDDDCWLSSPTHLARLWQWLQKNPQISAVGGPYHSPSGGQWSMRYYNWIANLWLELHSDAKQGDARLLGGNVVLRRQIFEDGWLFSREIRYGGAETELFARLREAGHQLAYVREFAVIHAGGVSWKDLGRKAWHQSRERAQRARSKYELNYWSRVWNFLRWDSRRWLTAGLALPFFIVGQFAFYYYRWKLLDE